MTDDNPNAIPPSDYVVPDSGGPSQVNPDAALPAKFWPLCRGNPPGSLPVKLYPDIHVPKHRFNPIKIELEADQVYNVPAAEGWLVINEREEIYANGEQTRTGSQNAARYSGLLSPTPEIAYARHIPLLNDKWELLKPDYVLGRIHVVFKPYGDIPGANANYVVSGFDLSRIDFESGGSFGNPPQWMYIEEISGLRHQLALDSIKIVTYYTF